MIGKSLFPSTIRRAGWTPKVLLGTLAMATGAVALTFDAWQDMVYLASRDEEARHMLLVPLVIVWLFAVRRHRLMYCDRSGTWIGPVVAFVGALAYVVGDKHLWQLVWHFGAITLLVGACLSLWGGKVLLNFLPVFGALVFLLPVPGHIRQEIAIPLQQTTAWATQQICDLIGFEAERSGNLLRINGIEVAVAEACNGMRMTFSLILIAYVFAFITPLKGYVRLLLILLSPVFAISCNVVRLVPTVWVYGRWPLETADVFHDVSGWVMLLVAFLLLTSILYILRWTAMPVTPLALARE